MSDPLDLEIANEIERISQDIKSILEKVETVFPKDPKPGPAEEANTQEEPTN